MTKQQLLKDIHKMVIERFPDKTVRARVMHRFNSFFKPNLRSILSHKFPNTKSFKFMLLGVGGSSVVFKVNNKSFRAVCVHPHPDLADKLKNEFDILTSHDFGILAPLDYCFISTNERNPAYWYEIDEATSYQGATYQEYSKLLHKTMKLANYNLFWNDIHNGNFMRDRHGNLVIVDFDVGHVDEWVKPGIMKYKHTKLSDIKPWLDRYISSPNDIRILRFMIYAYIKIPITNLNWMQYNFGEYMNAQHALTHLLVSVSK